MTARVSPARTPGHVWTSSTHSSVYAMRAGRELFVISVSYAPWKTSKVSLLFIKIPGPSCSKHR